MSPFSPKAARRQGWDGLATSRQRSSLLFCWFCNRNCLFVVARGLRILQDFAGFCRRNSCIFFICSRRFRTHNLLVPGSNPGGPTNPDLPLWGILCPVVDTHPDGK